MKDSPASIIKYILISFAITAVLIAAKIGIENTSWGHRAERLAFEFLQGQLSPFNQGEDLPVVVADISNVEQGEDQQIDLIKLEELVAAIAKERPRAIGIDAVLNPSTENLAESDAKSFNKLVEQTQRYYKFLDTLQGLREKYDVPIFVGVDEKVAEEPAKWLGGEGYQNMAGAILIEKDTTRMPVWFKAGAGAEKLYSISVLLAKSYQPIEIPQSLFWAVESEDNFPAIERNLEQNDKYASALINYSKLELIKLNKQPIKDAQGIDLLGEKFRNRIVILGKDDKAFDKFEIVGHPEKTFAGVYILACSTYTFIREPIYEFKFWVRLLLDLILSAVIIVWVAVARYRHIGERKSYKWEKLQSYLSVILFIVVGISAFLLVRLVGVLWLDFLLVAFFLWLHPKFEKILSSGFKK
jgi:hypothetical protein